jgi:methylmalonyl-CoA mutase
MALPTDFSAKIARDTQLYIQKETAVTRSIDPWAGSYFVERRTEELVEQAWALMQEVESLGGMAKAIEQGLPKLRIEEAAARKQAQIDSGTAKVVGVNVFQVVDSERFEILDVDNSVVRERQLARLQQVKEGRQETAVQAALAALEQAARDGGDNLLSCAIVAARARATLGEISTALEQVFGRYTATIQSISGVYAANMRTNEDFESARTMVDTFAQQEGRRPRIMVAKLGQDGHDRGAKIIATAFADLGFDVDIGPLFQTPAEAARQAAENDVHILGISSLAAGHKTLVPQTIAELKSIGRDDILVVVGGVIPQQDYEFLREAGAAAIFGPGTVVAKAAVELLEKLDAN